MRSRDRAHAAAGASPGDGGPYSGAEAAARQLAAGALGWLHDHAPYLDTPAARAELPPVPRLKALLQLALLCRVWSRVAPGDPALADTAAVVRQAWERPEMPRLLALDPAYARPLQLMYVALAPEGTRTAEPRSTLAKLSADGYLTPRRKPPYLHLETRFYAELAGAEHRLASYRELWAASRPARAAALPVAEPDVAGLDVCEVTHTVFYLSDFGTRDPGLTGGERGALLRVVDRLTAHCVRGGEWDLAGKLVLAQHCLGADPVRTESGAAALRMLSAVQAPGGAIPGKSAAERAGAGATPVEFFRRSYQSTLVTALATLIVTGEGRPVPEPGPAPVPVHTPLAVVAGTAAREAR
jgi:hypothetical protein